MKKLIRKLFPVLIIVGGLLYFFQRSGPGSTAQITSQLNLNFSPEQFTQVLGTATKSVVSTASQLVDRFTDDQEEALINSTVENISRQVKDLPASQVKKIKREFCSDIIEEATRIEDQ